MSKEPHLSSAVATFQDTLVNVTAEGWPYLGAPLGTQSYIEHYYVSKKYSSISSTSAATQPQAAYAYTHNMMSKWLYLTHTVPEIGPLLESLEDIQFIPASR